MEKTNLDTSILENCRISIVKGRGCRCEEEKTAAVIETDVDISPIMEYLSRTEASCGYNSAAKVCAFKTDKFGVVMEPGKITVVDAADISAAQEFLKWLKEKLAGAV